MFQGQEITDIREQYCTGERNFSNLQLRRSDLRGINLSFCDLSQADLSFTNLRNADLRGANLCGAYLDEADLTGANLEGANLKGASLIKTYLIKVNLQGANLSEAYLTGAYLTKSRLSQAFLLGTYLNNAKLNGADLKDVFYDEKTRFDSSFDLNQAGMQNINVLQISAISSPNVSSSQASLVLSLKEIKKEIKVAITVGEILNSLNYLSQMSRRYLGDTITIKYWELSRPQLDWIRQFTISQTADIIYDGTLKENLNSLQLEKFQEWIQVFIQSCSKILPDFPNIIDPDLISWSELSLKDYRQKNSFNSICEKFSPYLIGEAVS